MASKIFSNGFFFLKQKTAYEMRISDWSSDVCSSDLLLADPRNEPRQFGEAAGSMILQLLENEQRPFVGDSADEFVDERLDARVDRGIGIIGNFFGRRHGGKSNSLFRVTMALRGAYFLLESIGIFSLLTTPRRSAMKTSGNTILVTGGGSGIGLALAQRWPDAANHVIATGPTAPTLKAPTAGR